MLNVEASSLKNEMKTQCFSTTFHVRRLWKRLREFSFSCTLSCVEAWLRQGTSISSIISCEGRGAWGVDHCRSRYLLDQDLSCSPARTKWSAGEIPHVYLDLVEDLFLVTQKSRTFVVWQRKVSHHSCLLILYILCALSKIGGLMVQRGTKLHSSLINSLCLVIMCFSMNLFVFITCY